jgi:hypothetical protein
MDPNPASFRLSQTPQETEQQQSQSAEAQAGRTFSSVEELLRLDAAQTPPPERLTERVRTSIEREPPPKRSWWRRWFGWGAED